MTGTSDNRSALHGHARFVAKAGSEADLQQALLAVADSTRGEPGNLEVDLFRSGDQPSIFFMVATWRDQQALETHLGQEYVKSFLAELSDLSVEHSVGVARKVTATGRDQRQVTPP